jgi:hypothetical protein
MRRSALDFLGGMHSISLAELSAILAVTVLPLAADFAGTRFIQLYLYAHRVDGLLPSSCSMRNTVTLRVMDE